MKQDHKIAKLSCHISVFLSGFLTFTLWFVFASISFISLGKGKRELNIASTELYSSNSGLKTVPHCIFQNWWKTGVLEYWNTEYWKWIWGILDYHRGSPVPHIRPTHGGLHRPSPHNHKQGFPLFNKEKALFGLITIWGSSSFKGSLAYADWRLANKIIMTAEAYCPISDARGAIPILWHHRASCDC